MKTLAHIVATVGIIILFLFFLKKKRKENNYCLNRPFEYIVCK